MKHLDEGILQAWVDRARSGISRTEVAEIERHLRECEDCAARASAAESLTVSARAILSSAGPADPGIPDFGSVVARARGVPADTAVRRRWWIATAWAASVAGALAAGWISSDRLRSTQVALDSETDPPPAAGASAGTAVEATAAGPSPETEVALESAAPSVQEANVGGSGAGVASAEVARGSDQMDSAVASAAAAPPAARSEPVAALATATRPSVVGGPGADLAPAAIPVVRRESIAALATATGPATGPSVLSGRVIHDLTGEPVNAAQMSIDGTSTGALSRADGTFSIALEAGGTPLGPVTLLAQRLGFQAVRLTFDPVRGDTLFVDVRLAPQQLALQGIVATGLVDPLDPRDVVSPRDVTPLDVAPASARQAADGATPSPAASSLAGRLTSAGIDWVATARAEAGARVGFQVLVVPELTLLGIELGEVSGAPIVRVRQRLDSGAVLTLLEQRTNLPSIAPSPLAAEGSVVSSQRGDVLITGIAPIPTDSLRILLDRAR